MTPNSSKQTIVFTPTRLLKLVTTDLRNILRDPTLLAVMIFSLSPVLIFIFFKTQMNEAAFSAFGIEKITLYAAPVFLILPAYLIGWIIGFLILEEHDEGPLIALETTPVGKRGIVAYRALLAFTLTFILSVIAAPYLFESISILSIALLATFSALEAVMVTFALPAIANNKVQGLAFTKVMNLFSMTCLLAIIASPWRYLAGITPAFWVGEYVSISTVSFLTPLEAATLGLAIHLILPVVFYRLLLKKSG